MRPEGHSKKVLWPPLLHVPLPRAGSGGQSEGTCYALLKNHSDSVLLFVKWNWGGGSPYNLMKLEWERNRASVVQGGSHS
jgi:hypothetical protein